MTANLPRALSAAWRMPIIGALVAASWGCALAPEDRATASAAHAGDARLLQVAERMRERGRIQEALLVYDGLLQRAPRDPAVLGGLGETLLTGGYPDAALPYFLSALDELEDREAGTAERWTRASPALRRGMVGLGRAHIALGQYEAAATVLGRADERFPDRPVILNALAVSRDLVGAHDEAQALYRRALELAPEDAGIRANLALSLDLGGREPASHGP